MIMVVSTLWKLYDMVITARMKVCARVDPSMSTASKGVDARHNLHVAVDIVALRASRDESQLQCVKDLERGFPTCERNDVALSQRASGVSAHIVEAKAAMNADGRIPDDGEVKEGSPSSDFIDYSWSNVGLLDEHHVTPFQKLS